MDHTSKKIRYRRRKPLIWYIVLVAVIGALGFALYPVVQKKVFREQEKEKISQIRWLYWCAGSQEAEMRPCYYVNRDGVIVDEAPRLRGNLFPKLYDELAGEKRIEERLLAFIRRFYDFGQFIVKNDETLEIGWPGSMQLKTSLKDDPEEIDQNLALILEREIKERKDEVDYIDLRFGNRVYYKFR